MEFKIFKILSGMAYLDFIFKAFIHVEKYTLNLFFIKHILNLIKVGSFCDALAKNKI